VDDEWRVRASQQRDMEAAMSDTASRHVTGQAAGIHPTVFKVAVGAVLWFIVVVWTAFAGPGGIDFYLAIVTLFCAIFVSLFLLVASFTTGDTRWPTRRTSFRAFLDSDVGIGGETMRGRDVLIEIVLVPVVLAFAATLIGLAWMIFG
jgi:hypothetical protein